MDYAPIYMFDEWIKESEQVNPQAQQSVIDPASQPPIPAESQPLEEPEQSINSEKTELERFEEIDRTRKAAIKEFKEKQKQFLAIPIETRKNPMNEDDKQKVEDLKSELSTLNQAMKDAVAEYDKFNDEMLGTTSTETDVEP